MESRTALSELLGRHGIGRNAPAAEKLADYLALLEKWGARIRLTSSTEWSNLCPLFEEGIWAAGLYPPRATRHLDIGSGAGFPALPLAVLQPRVAVDLVEPQGKRAAFLEAVAADLQLENVRVHQTRLDDLLEQNPDATWDTVSWKAIRLDDRDLRRLRDRAPHQLWIFHGRTLPADEAEILKRYELTLRQPVPGRSAAWLSVYSGKR